MGVKFRKKAELDLENIIAWIISEGYPLTAHRFLIRVLKFCKGLDFHAEKYPICRFKLLAARNYRCAVFAKNYIVVYKIQNDSVVIT